MRTTLTLDDDLAALLQEAARTRGVPFKAVVNQALRDGIGANVEPKAFETATFPLGARPGFNIDKALQLSTELEDEETLRKLDLGK